jgi:Ca2+-transporting ATPase
MAPPAATPTDTPRPAASPPRTGHPRHEEAPVASSPETAGAPVPWHATEIERALELLDSGRGGLTVAEAQRRLARDGPNTIPRAPGDGSLRLLWRQVHNPLIWMLIAAAAIAILLGKVLDGLVVLGVVVANGAIGFAQEFRAGRAIDALLELVPEFATVLRDGVRRRVPAAELVRGDVVLLRSGDKVPADLRLLEARALRVDESTLTGESVSVEKDLAPVEAQASLSDRTALAFGGTLVTLGRGSGVVVATGAETELGRISSLLERAEPQETPLTAGIARVARWLTVAIGVLALVLFAVGVLRGYGAADALLAAIALAVGAIPEALPAVVTIALAIGVQRMAHRRALVRRLPAVETLGSTTVICTDKTGTLTRNEMTVEELWTPRATYRLSGVGYAPEGELSRGGVRLEGPPPDLTALARALLLCNDATLRKEDGRWHLHGEPTEGALVVAAAKLGLDAGEERARTPRLAVMPFESEHRFMATLDRDAGRSVIHLKGAPETVLPRCDGAHDRAARAAVDRMTQEGMRVIAVAAKPHEAGSGAGQAVAARPKDRVAFGAPGAGSVACEAVDARPKTGSPSAPHGGELEAPALGGGFELLGVVGMIDPPRPEAIAAVAACRRAGVEVKMITGDHAGTAAAIAAEMRLPTREPPAVEGRELERLGPEELAEVARDANVFARVAPEHKLRLVRALQDEGHVVAMTGDGVNDAPALRQADIGVAMGVSGSSVSKEAADIVLADDNFATIAAAVEEGRRIYDNLVKALVFVLPTNLGFALIVLASVLGFPLVDGSPLHALEPVQLLWINLVATPLLSLPLAFEAPEPELMDRPPRPPGTPILDRFVLARTALVAVVMAAAAITLFLLEYDGRTDAGVPHEQALAEAQTMAVTTVALLQCFYLLQCRSLTDSLLAVGLWTNRAVYLGIGGLLVLQLGFTYLPFMNELFGSAPLSASAWLEATLTALVVVPVIWLEKRRRRRLRRPALPAAG